MIDFLRQWVGDNWVTLNIIDRILPQTVLVSIVTVYIWNKLFWLGMSLGRGPGLIEGHLAHRGPGRFFLAQVRPGPEKNGPNSTHRDEFRLRPSLAWPGPGLIEGHFWGLARHGPGRAGPGPSSARDGKKRPKLIPSFDHSKIWLSFFSIII